MAIKDQDGNTGLHNLLHNVFLRLTTYEGDPTYFDLDSLQMMFRYIIDTWNDTDIRNNGALYKYREYMDDNPTYTNTWICNLQNNQGETPLHQWVKEGHDWLVQHPGSFNNAMWKYWFLLIRELLGVDTNPAIQDRKEKTVLHYYRQIQPPLNNKETYDQYQKTLQHISAHPQNAIHYLNLENKNYINNLPNELLLSIFSQLSPTRLYAVSQVSRRFNNLASDVNLWMHYLKPNYEESLRAYIKNLYNNKEHSLEVKKAVLTYFHRIIRKAPYVVQPKYWVSFDWFSKSYKEGKYLYFWKDERLYEDAMLKDPFFMLLYTLMHVELKLKDFIADIAIVMRNHMMINNDYYIMDNISIRQAVQPLSVFCSFKKSL